MGRDRGVAEVLGHWGRDLEKEGLGVELGRLGGGGVGVGVVAGNPTWGAGLSSHSSGEP